jgi:CheY-specific phosphatase CheX
MGGLKPEEIGPLFTQALMEVVATVSGFSLDMVSSGETDESFHSITGFMSLNGEKPAMLFLSAEEPCVRQICSYMTGVAADKITADDIADTLCELINMVAGSVKLRLSDSEYKYNITIPMVLHGERMRLTKRRKSRLMSCTVGNGDIELKLKVMYL